ncbi:MAG: hypothetical protein PUD41_07275, partial [bacterium]|nr:hypothetical protein [bacterium]
NPGAHITRLLRHHKTIVFIQIKHSKTFWQQSSPKFCSPKSRLISDAYVNGITVVVMRLGGNFVAISVWRCRG